MKTESARPIKAGKHLWYMYNGKKPVVLKTGTGSATMKKGDLFGVQNLNNRSDRLVMQKMPTLRFIMGVEDAGELIEQSKRIRENVEFLETEKPIRLPKPVKEKPAKVTKPAKAPAKPDRLSAIRDAAKKKAVKVPIQTKPKKKRESFDLDEDTFNDDSFIDLHDFM